MRLGPYDTGRVHLRDCLEGMKALPENSIDTVCTDPPYGLEFMGKEWDRLTYSGGNPSMKSSGKQIADRGDGRWQPGSSYGARNKNPRCRRCGKLKRGNGCCKCPEPSWDTRKSEGAFAMQCWHEDWATEALRVAKPGAILLAFGGTRTFHRLACAIEDAGWELRDNIGYPNSGCPWLMAWVFGSGFPKSLAMDKAIDEKAFHDWLDAHPEEKEKYLEQLRLAKGDSKATEHVRRKFRKAAGTEREVVGHYESPEGTTGWKGQDRRGCYSGPSQHADGEQRDLTAPSTPLAREWDGWGTALKPAWEPVLVAMKPLDGTFAENAQKWGVAGLNIDGARVGTEPRSTGTRNPHAESGVHGTYGLDKRTDRQQRYDENKPSARFPSNLIHDGSPEVVGRFPTTASPAPYLRTVGAENAIYGKGRGDRIAGHIQNGFGDTGSASRFFYSAKASRREREVGLIGHVPCVKCGELNSEFHLDENGDPVPCVRNSHPTVKPFELTRYLARLTKTPTGGVVLDPFAGSGTTGMACKIEGREFIGFEKEAEYVEIANRRIPAAFDALEPDPGPRVKDLPGQKMLFEEP